MTQTGIEPPSERNRTAERRVFKIRGMDCAEEVAVLKDVVGPVVGGAANLSFDILNGRMTVAATAAADDGVVKGAVAKTSMHAERFRPTMDDGYARSSPSLVERSRSPALSRTPSWPAALAPHSGRRARASRTTCRGYRG